MPNHEEIYRQQAEKYERMISRQPNVVPWIEEIRPVQGLDVLDLGAGTGRISVRLADKAGSLVSTDKSEAMLKVLKKKAAGRIFLRGTIGRPGSEQQQPDAR